MQVTGGLWEKQSEGETRREFGIGQLLLWHLVPPSRCPKCASWRVWRTAHYTSREDGLFLFDFSSFVLFVINDPQILPILGV